MKNHNENSELNLTEKKTQKEQADKWLLTAEIWIAVLGLLFFLGAVAVAAFVELPDFARILIIAGGAIVFLLACFFALKIEQVAGYYECKHCHKRYVPTYKQVILAMHVGRTRYLKCPNCGKKSWQKKVLSDKE